MKKIMIIVLLSVPLSAYSFEFFMDKCIKSWIGYPLDSVIESWGYPKQEKDIAGRKLYVWETYDTSMDYRGGTSIIKTDKKGNETIFTMGGQPEIEYCIKTLEVDKDNNIIKGQWEGNACPNFYIVGKKLVNPLNDEWAKKKGSKNSR